MNETNKTNLTNQKKLRLNKITGIESYFNSEINQKNHALKN